MTCVAQWIISSTEKMARQTFVKECRHTVTVSKQICTSGATHAEISAVNYLNTGNKLRIVITCSYYVYFPSVLFSFFASFFSLFISSFLFFTFLLLALRISYYLLYMCWLEHITGNTVLIGGQRYGRDETILSMSQIKVPNRCN
jgi:hypothetical protein